jgi:hypothetical protein
MLGQKSPLLCGYYFISSALGERVLWKKGLGNGRGGADFIKWWAVASQGPKFFDLKLPFYGCKLPD